MCRKVIKLYIYLVPFRFSEENVEWMAEHFLGEAVETRGGAMSPKQQMDTLLYTLGDPDFQSGVAAVTGFLQTTVSKNISRVVEKITEKTNTWIKFPHTNNDIDNAVLEWTNNKTVPHAFGSVDCTHIRIKKPTLNGDEYSNRKGYPSINIQATIDSSERFTSVDASWPGSVHDSHIWRNSNIFPIVSNNARNAALLADEG